MHGALHFGYTVTYEILKVNPREMMGVQNLNQAKTDEYAMFFLTLIGIFSVIKIVSRAKWCVLIHEFTNIIQKFLEELASIIQEFQVEKGDVIGLKDALVDLLHGQINDIDEVGN